MMDQSFPSFSSSGWRTLNLVLIRALRAAIKSIGYAAGPLFPYPPFSPYSDIAFAALLTPLYSFVTVLFKRAIGLGFSIYFKSAAK